MPVEQHVHTEALSLLTFAIGPGAPRVALQSLQHLHVCMPRRCAGQTEVEMAHARSQMAETHVAASNSFADRFCSTLMQWNCMIENETHGAIAYGAGAFSCEGASPLAVYAASMQHTGYIDCYSSGMPWHIQWLSLQRSWAASLPVDKALIQSS